MLSSKIVRWETRSKKEPVRIGTARDDYNVERLGYIDARGVVQYSSGIECFRLNSADISPLTGEELISELIAYLEENSIHQQGGSSELTVIERTQLCGFILLTLGFDNNNIEDGDLGDWLSLACLTIDFLGSRVGVATLYWSVAALVNRGCTNVFSVNNELGTMIDLLPY